MNAIASSLTAAAVLLALTGSAGAEEPRPLLSFSYQSQWVPCSGQDTLMPFDASGHWKLAPGQASVGSGVFPTAPFTIRRVAVAHWIVGDTVAAYAVVGHSGPRGDHVSPYVVGQGAALIGFDADAAPLFQPGEYLDVHASCSGKKHQATVQVWYTVP